MLFSKSYWAADFGTDRLRLMPPKPGPVFDQPAAALVDRRGKRPQATLIGDRALALAEPFGAGLRLEWPLRHGIVMDFEVAAQLVTRFLGTAGAKGDHAVVTVNGLCGAVARRAVQECWEVAGCRKIYLMDQCFAAGLGAGLPVSDSQPSLVACLGAGVTEIALLGSGQTLLHAAAPMGGRDLDGAIVTALRRRHGLRVAPHAAQQLRHAIGTATPPEGEGRTADIASATVSERTLAQATTPVLERIADFLLDFCEVARLDGAIPPVLHLTGGLALMPGLRGFLEPRLGMEVAIASQPDQAVLRGCALARETL